MQSECVRGREPEVAALAVGPCSRDDLDARFTHFSITLALLCVKTPGPEGCISN